MWKAYVLIFSQKSVQRYFLARTFSRISTNLIPVVVSCELLKQYHSATLLSAYLTAFTVGLAVGSIAGGYLTDRYGPWAILLGSDTIRAFNSVVAIWALGHLGPTLSMGLFLGILGGAAAVAVSVVPKKIIPADQIAVGVSSLSSVGQLLFLIIPLTSMGLMALRSPTLRWLVVALLYAVAAVQFALMPHFGANGGPNLKGPCSISGRDFRKRFVPRP
ncbi:hypothetical protein TPY_2148 [Sulfobacillus acidophilus TPY]|nr:hypothetical protein TPY_2148 [Sulfobacillus acidophilus TPY]